MADRANRQAEVTAFGPGNKQITSTTSGSKELLDVSAIITNNESPTKYQLKTDYDATGDTITSASDTTLYTFSGSGVLNFIGVSNATTSNYEVAIFVDGTERFRITMGDLGSVLGLTSGSTPMWCETANKNFRFRPYEGIGFTTSFTVKARATGSNTTVTHITMFKEKVT